MTDPIADMLARIRNAVTAKHTRVDMPASRLKADISRSLQDEGYIQGFNVLEEADQEDAGDEDAAPVPQVRTARRAIDYRRPAHQPPGPPRLLRTRRCAGRARGTRHEHPDDLARRDDRPQRREGRRRRRGRQD